MDPVPRVRLILAALLALGLTAPVATADTAEPLFDPHSVTEIDMQLPQDPVADVRRLAVRRSAKRVARP